MFAGGALLALIPAAASAQPARTVAPVRIDFRAVGDEGQVVADLKPDQLLLKVNGKPRAIKSLNLFLSSAGAATRSDGLPPPYATNVSGQQGRAIHVLIDDQSILPGREAPVKEAMSLLTAELSPDDRIGLLTSQGQVNLAVSHDIQRVRLAAGAIAGRGSAQETDADLKCRTKLLLATIGSMLSLTGGAPTTIVIFSSGISAPAVKTVVLGSRGASGTSDVCPVEPADFANIGDLASLAHADLYLFDLLDGRPQLSLDQDAGFESLAGVTGAEFVRLTASAQPSVSRLLRETSAYYVATFDPDPGERDGQVLRVELKTAREKVQVRVRPAVQMPKDVAPKAAPSPKDMLRVATEYRDLPLRATGYASRMPGGPDVKIVALFETPDGTPLAAASVGLFDEKNTLKKQWTAQRDDLAKPAVRADLTAPPGTYRVRVAAVDGSGRAGTTDYELQADTVRADPLKLSTLVIGTQQQGAGFIPRLEFTSEPVAIGLLEIYGVPKDGTVTVQLDVASTPQGQALASADTQLRPGASDDTRIAIGGFAIDQLPPGDYLMRAVVSLDGKPVGKVVRTLRKTK